MPISAIILGKRHRRDLGDIDALAANIAAIGMLHSIVVRPDGTLIAGERRIEAAKALGWSEVPVNIVDLDAVVRGEFAENSLRKDFTLSEAVAIKRALEPLERAGAKERQGERPDKHLEKFYTSSHGRAFDKVANVIGKHRTTIAPRMWCAVVRMVGWCSPPLCFVCHSKESRGHNDPVETYSTDSWGPDWVHKSCMEKFNSWADDEGKPCRLIPRVDVLNEAWRKKHSA